MFQEEWRGGGGEREREGIHCTITGSVLGCLSCIKPVICFYYVYVSIFI